MENTSDRNANAVHLFNKYATLYQQKYMDVSLYHDTFDIFCENILVTNATVLELACGPGNITSYLLQKRPDFKILATDLSENMIQLAKANNPTAECSIMDCRNILQLGRSVDAVMCGFALPYLAKDEALQLIADSAKIIAKNGVLYISTMEDDYENSGIRKGSQGDEIYMYFHRADYLTDCLLKNGFELISTLRKQYTQGDTMVIDLILIAKKL